MTATVFFIVLPPSQTLMARSLPNRKFLRMLALSSETPCAVVDMRRQVVLFGRLRCRLASGPGRQAECPGIPNNPSRPPEE
jgi:hypothetical protein